MVTIFSPSSVSLPRLSQRALRRLDVVSLQRARRFPFLFRHPYDHVPEDFRLAAQPVPWLGERLPVQKVLLVEIDLRQMLPTALDFHPARRARGVSAAVMVEGKAQRLGRVEQAEIRLDLAGDSPGMQERHLRHPNSIIPAETARTSSAPLS